MKKDTFYFSHDYNSRNDIKVKKLIVKHGYEGYGIFWALIEDLYQNDNVLPLDYDCIAYDLRSTSNKIKAIINDFNLFEIGDNTFGSLSIQRRLDKRDEKSRRARKSAAKRWGDDANASENDANALESDANASENDANAMRTHSNSDANAMQTQCDRNAIKERKGKDTKVKDTKIKDTRVNQNKNAKTKSVFNFRKALLDYGFQEELVDEWLTIRKNKRSVNSEFAYNSFIAQVKRAGGDKNELLRTIAERQWAGFNIAWLTNTNNNLNGGITNEADRQSIESGKRKQEIIDFARSVGMVGGEENPDTSNLW